MWSKISQRNWRRPPPFLAAAVYVAVGLFILLSVWATNDYVSVVLPPERLADGLLANDFLTLPPLTLLLFAVSVLYGLSTFAWRPWTLADYAPVERWLLTLLVLFQVHACAFMEYNHYYDEWFIWARVAVAVFALAVLVCPAFIPAFLIVCAMMTSQVHFEGLFKYDHNHKALIEPTLFVIWAVGGLRHLLRRDFPHMILYLMLSVFAVWYLKAGVGKWRLDWHDANNVYHMYAAAHGLHWRLDGISPAFSEWVGNTLLEYRAFVNYSGILIECVFPLLFVYRRWLSIIIFLANVGLHLSILALSGIFFYQWVVIELFLIGWWLFRQHDFRGFWGWKPTLIILPFILINWRFSGATMLAWIDSNYVETYTFTLETDRGEVPLDPSFFAPYDYSFNQNRFYFLSGNKAFTKSLGGASNPEVLDILSRPLSAEELRQAIADYRRRKEKSEVDGDKRNRFLHFVTTSIRNKMRYDPKLISYLSPMNHIQSIEGQKNVAQARPESLTILYEGRRVLPGLEYDIISRDSIVIPLVDEP